MGKRKLVPAALHKELSEYTSLLRALQTNDTLDLASQLTKPRPKASTSQQSTPGVDLDDERDQPVPSTVASRDITPSALSTKSRTSLKRSSSGKVVKEKDNWTRWPLLVEDIHAPEFSFQDEVKMLALHTLKKQEPIDSMDGPSEEQDEDAILPQPFLEAMTFECSTHLSRILSALAVHIPPVEKSMQNRIKPMNWEGVLDIVAVSGLVDSKIVQDVQRRMELLYGPAANNSASRAQLSASAKLHFDDLCATHDLSLLTFPEPVTADPPPPKRKKREKFNEEIERSADL